MTDQRTPTLFIGLDGFTFRVLDRLTQSAAAGQPPVMPFLAELLEGSFRADLRSTPHPLTPPAWTTLMTGKPPGEHGVYDFMRVRESRDDVFFTLYDYRDIRAETIWSIASRQQRSVVSLNFPMMAPPPTVNGSLIPGFTSARHLRRNSYPPKLFERFESLPDFDHKALAWDFERENEIGEEMTDAHLAQWISYHLPRERLWFEVARLLLVEDRPDLLAAMFDGADKIQHQAWRYIDPALEPTTPDASWLELRALCDSYYQRLDGYIQGLVEAAGPSARVFFASDHGFCTTNKVFRVNRALAELGYLTYKSVPNTPEGQRRAASPFAFLDWEHTLAYCPTPSSNAIRIRVAQQPGAPGVAPAEYESFRARLIEQLLAWPDPATGKPIVTEVRTRETIFPGQAMEDAPDLTLTLADHGFVSIRNLEPTVIDRPTPAGTHHPLGVFIAAGPGIQAGVAESPLEIADVAATLLYSLGLAVPEDMQGRVAEQAFTAEQRRTKPVRIGAPSQPPGKTQLGLESEPETDAEKQKILDQLAMLGYLEE